MIRRYPFPAKNVSRIALVLMAGTVIWLGFSFITGVLLVKSDDRATEVDEQALESVLTRKGSK